MKRATKQASCDGKQRHATRIEAEAQLTSLARQGAAGFSMNTYRCRFCRCWHVGHRRWGGRR